MTDPFLSSIHCYYYLYSSFTDAIARYDSYYGRPNKTVHLLNVGCDGTEDSIGECSKTAVTLNAGKSLYANASAAGLDCQPEPPTQPACVTASPDFSADGCINGQVRTVGGVNGVGRLEYCYVGAWSPFCYLDETTAAVACKNLNYNAYTCKESLHILSITYYCPPIRC